MSAPAPDMRRQGFRRALASIAGTALEYYDFAVYNTLAALVFNELFFPTVDPLAGTLLSFATYWVGYLSRPLGGVLFGPLGDRHGRRFVLVLTLLLMGAATTAIGLLPTYSQVGVWAPVLLVMLRFVQGVALGGEWAGAVLLTMEHGEDARRGRNAAWAQMGPSTGVLVATASIALMTAMLTTDQQHEWGWRLPLLASVVLVGFGLWLRVGVPETPQFRALAAERALARAPLGEVLRGHRRGLLVAGGSRFGPDVMYSLITAFLVAYLTRQLELSRTLATTAVALGSACNILSIFAAGSLSDRLGRRTVYGAGAIGAFVWLLALFPLVHQKSAWAVILAVVSGLTIHGFMYGPQGAFITEQFPARVRYAGASVAYTFAGVFAGGIAPLAFTALYGRFGSPLAIVAYASAALAITGLALHLSRSRHAPSRSPRA